MDSIFEIKLGKRRRSCKLEEDDDGGGDTSNRQTITGIEFLPRDIVLDILSRLPITSLIQFKFVCRAWNKLTQDPSLASMQLSRTSKANPCLVFHCDNPIRNQLFFIDISAQKGDKETAMVKKIDTPFSASMPEFDIIGTCNGLLCLWDSLYNDAIYIYNPFTNTYLELPKSLKYMDQEVVFGFGFDSKTNEYKVVKIIYYRNNVYGSFSPVRRITYLKSDVQILTLGSSPMWRSLGKVSYQLDRRPAGCLVNGRLHWATRRRRYHGSRTRCIVSFDMGDEKFREVPKPDCGSLNRCNYYLLVLGSCLAAAVYFNNGKLEIWVMKEYDVKESWIKEFSIGAYLPKGLKQVGHHQHHHHRSICRIWKNSRFNGRGVGIVCVLKNGEILLEYKGRVLVSYDPKSGKFKDLMFQKMPKLFQTYVHVGSLNWIDSSIDT